MKSILIFTFFFSTHLLLAQTFTEVPSARPFEGTQDGSIAFSDVNGDGHPDILITGGNTLGVGKTRLFTNDGTGIFIEVKDTPFEGVIFSSIAFSDVNGDDHPDIMITGLRNSFTLITKLYINDGTGAFTEMMGTPFEGVYFGSIAFSDINGDGLPDVLVTGQGITGIGITKLYINNGMGAFTERTDTPFEDVDFSSIAFSDVNGDDHPDVMITGRDTAFNRITKLYTNDGAGSFTEMMGTPFAGVKEGSIAFSDVNNDGHTDVMITGEDSSEVRIAKLYTNDGKGFFTEMMGTSFEGVIKGSIVFSDINGDNSPDLTITGKNNSDVGITKLYTNDGIGVFTEMVTTSLENLESSSIAFADVNSDGSLDIMTTGKNTVGVGIARLYTNNGAGVFTEGMGTPFEGVDFSSIAFSDVNGDDHPDVMITGRNNSLTGDIKLCINDGAGAFTEMTGTPFEGVSGSSIAFSDVNSDGHPDVTVTGSNNNSILRITKLYTNDGMGNFTEMAGTPFETVDISSIAFSDVNGDSHPDLMITGRNNSFIRIAKLYTNDGTGNFTEMTGTPFEGVDLSSIAFSDVNDDSYPDLMITGRNNSLTGTTKLYTNDGAGNFTEMTGTPFEGVKQGSVAFSDVNSDGHSDVMITGENVSEILIAKLYTNDGTGNFTETTGTPFEGVGRSSIAFSDVNGDGHSDVMITGENASEIGISKLYINDETGSFTEIMGTPFEEVRSGSIAFSDVNNDGLPDLMITGKNNSNDISLNRIAKLYINDGIINSVTDPSAALNYKFSLYP